MVLKTYFTKNNTIVKNSYVNTGLNPIAELFYGGTNVYSRFLFQIDETRLKDLYTGGTYTDLSKLTHRLKMINTGAFDKELLNQGIGGKARTSSFDLIVFKIDQPWDNGTGYDLVPQDFICGDSALVCGYSNWSNPQNGILWSGGS